MSVCFCLLLKLILGSVCVCAYRQVIVCFPFCLCMKLKGQFAEMIPKTNFLTQSRQVITDGDGRTCVSPPLQNFLENKTS